MSNRYRVEVTIEGSYDPTPTYRVLDYCVKPGELPKRLSVGSDAMGAINFARNLNKEDDVAKAEWDAEHQDVRNRLQDRVAQFSMDVETHAKCYFIGANGLAVYGSHEAIDHLRGKLNSRYKQIMDLGHINRNLRANLKDAQQAADKFKAELADARAWWGSDYAQVSNAAVSRSLGVPMADHVARLEEKSKELEALRKRISEL